MLIGLILTSVLVLLYLCYLSYHAGWMRGWHDRSALESTRKLSERR